MARYILVCFALILAACKSDPVTLTISGKTMGTTYNITAIDKGAELDAKAVKTAIEATLTLVNGQMSNWDPNSEISVFNAAKSTEPVTISAELAKVMAAANTVHKQSQGQFDVTLGPLIELWGFGARTPESPVPADTDIEAALNITGQLDVLTLTTNPDTMAKTYPDTSVYLAAIAKGYGVDQLAATLHGLGLTDYMVEIGGDLVTAGNNPDGAPWRIGIERPVSGAQKVEEIVKISDLGMATSGDYRNYFEAEGVRYSHVIDAVTGRPISHTTASVTVLAKDAMMADAWATALLALGAERGLKIAEDLDLAVFFILRDTGSNDIAFTTTASSQFKKLQVSP